MLCWSDADERAAAHVELEPARQRSSVDEARIQMQNVAWIRIAECVGGDRVPKRLAGMVDEVRLPASIRLVDPWHAPVGEVAVAEDAKCVEQP